MKQTRKLTRKMKIQMTAEGLNPADWRCTMELKHTFIVRHERTGEIKVILK